MANESKQNNGPALAALSTLFFMFGFISCISTILVPYLKNLFTLTNWQSNLINSAFFLAYLIISIPSGMLVKKVGYKMGAVIGLIGCAVGSFIFVFCAKYPSFPLFLTATFVIATGVTVLQVAVNPFVTLIGDPESASARLNLTQGLNSLGTYVAPLIGSALIFKGITDNMSVADKALRVQGPYMYLGLALIVVGIGFAMLKLPNPLKVSAGAEGAKKEEDAFEKLHGSAWGYRHVILGMLAIFAYVGAEVATGSNIIEYLKASTGIDASVAAPFAAIYWGGAMIGRFYAGLMLGKGETTGKTHVLGALVAIGAFVIAYIALKNPVQAAIFFGIAVANYLCFQIGSRNDKRTLAVFAVIAALLAIAPIIVSGKISMWTICSIGLFNSIMFPTIFSLGVAKLGKHTPQGSAALCVGIVGGGIIPLIWGFISDKTNSVTIPFVVCALCYAYIAFFALVGSKTEEVKAKAV
jgi:FHS family L-fucose permease-like MFS transporter